MGIFFSVCLVNISFLGKQINIHGILTPLPMVYRTPYPWYLDPSAYLLIRNEGVQFSIREGAIYHG
jgi:hypothetical protein